MLGASARLSWIHTPVETGTPPYGIDVYAETANTFAVLSLYLMIHLFQVFVNFTITHCGRIFARTRKNR